MKLQYNLLGLILAALFLLPLTSEAQRRKKVQPVKTAYNQLSVRIEGAAPLP